MGDESETIHPILARAIEAAAPADHPAAPHLGGPIPVLRGPDQLAVALWCASVARPHVPAEHAKAFDAAVKKSRRWWTKPEKDYKKAYVAYRDLEAAANACKSPLPAVETGRWVAAAARSLAKGGATTGDVNKFTRSAAVTVARLLGADVASPRPEVRSYLVALDGRLLLAELEALLEEREVTPASAPAQVLYRPPGKSKGPGLILVRLEDGGLGLLAKLGTRWRWTDGDRDHVLATVPDELFEGAVKASET